MQCRYWVKPMKENDYFNDVYLKRLNRYGLNYQQRIQTQRESMFEQKLLKSVYHVFFEYNGHEEEGSFEKYKQDETETLHYLLTKVSLNIPNGTILEIPDKDGMPHPWMVYWVEHIVASGYNKYVMLRMTHYLTWKDNDGNIQNSWAYMYGQQNGPLVDEIKSGGRGNRLSLYAENTKSSFFVMPLNENLKRDNYLEIGEGKLQEAYRVTGYDIQSSEGVEYVTIDPVPIRNNAAAPMNMTGEEEEDDFFWLQGENQGGVSNGCT